MKIVRATLTRVRLRMRAPLQTARGRLAVREGMVLALSTDSELQGYGEALPLAGFGAESIERSCEVLPMLARAVLGRDPLDLEVLLDEAEAQAPDAPAARAALDAALFDLAARTRETSVAAWLAAPRTARDRVRVSALLRAEEPSAGVKEAREARLQGFRTLKLKVGARDLPFDEARVAAIREAVGPDVEIRLDANGAWKEADAALALARFAPYAIEFCEQPVAANDLDGLARLRASSPIAIAADESLAGGRGVAEILERQAADLLVLKPAALGGLRASLRIAAAARAKGVGCIVTSALDSALGLSTALQLASALPDPLPDSGLATGGAFVEDLAPAPLPEAGKITLPRGLGLGVVPSADALGRCTLGKPMEMSLS